MTNSATHPTTSTSVPVTPTHSSPSLSSPSSTPRRTAQGLSIKSIPPPAPLFRSPSAPKVGLRHKTNNTNTNNNATNNSTFLDTCDNDPNNENNFDENEEDESIETSATSSKKFKKPKLNVGKMKSAVDLCTLNQSKKKHQPYK